MVKDSMEFEGNVMSRAGVVGVKVTRLSNRLEAEEPELVEGCNCCVTWNQSMIAAHRPLLLVVSRPIEVVARPACSAFYVK